jgi:hypothetical protein
MNLVNVKKEEKIFKKRKGEGRAKDALYYTLPLIS